MATSWTGLPVPDIGAPPNVPADMMTLGHGLDSVTVPVFANTTARDAARTAGAQFNVCMIAGVPWMIKGGSWVTLAGMPDIPQISLPSAIFGQVQSAANATVPVTQASVAFTTTNAAHGISSNSSGFIVITPGWYRIAGHATFPSGTSAIRFYIGFNGVAQSSGQGATVEITGAVTEANVLAYASCAAGDVIGLRISGSVATTFQAGALLCAEYLGTAP